MSLNDRIQNAKNNNNNLIHHAKLSGKDLRANIIFFFKYENDSKHSVSPVKANWDRKQNTHAHTMEHGRTVVWWLALSHHSEVLGLNPLTWHVLHMCAWVLFGYSGFFPQSQDMQSVGLV